MLKDLPDWWPHDKPYAIMDCLEGMRELPDNSIDMILTDPPFNVSIDYGKNTNDEMTDEEYKEWFTQRLVDMERVMKDGHPMIIFTGDKKIKSILDAVDKTNLIFHHFIKWNKQNGQRGLSGFVLFYRTELALLLTKGKPIQNLLNRTILYSDTITHLNTKPNDKDAVDHPCRRPLSLYENLINGFNVKYILDPFLGSGTTLRACRETGRIGLGFEIEKDYEPIIKKRMMEEIPKLERWF